MALKRVTLEELREPEQSTSTRSSPTATSPPEANSRTPSSTSSRKAASHHPTSTNRSRPRRSPPDFRWPDQRPRHRGRQQALARRTRSPARTTPPARPSSRPTASASSASPGSRSMRKPDTDAHRESERQARPVQPLDMLTLPAGRRPSTSSSPRPRFFSGLASQAGKFEGVQKNESSSWLPGRRRVGQGARSRPAAPGRRARAGRGRVRAPGRPDRRRQAADQRHPHASSTRTAPRLVLEAQEPVFSPRTERRRSSSSPSSPARASGTRSRTACSRSATAPASRSDGPRGQAHRRGRLQPRRDQGLRRRQRPAAARRGEHRARPADRHLPLADLLGDPVLRGRARRGRLARRRLPARRGRA